MKTENKNTPLKVYMGLSGLTYQDIADKTGLSKQAVWLHANGRQGMSGKAACAYHKALGISLERLIADDQQGNQAKSL